MQALLSDTSVQILVSAFPNCVTLDKSFTIAMPQLLYLYKGAMIADTPRVVKLLWGYQERMWEA